MGFDEWDVVGRACCSGGGGGGGEWLDGWEVFGGLLQAQQSSPICEESRAVG